MITEKPNYLNIDNATQKKIIDIANHYFNNIINVVEYRNEDYNVNARQASDILISISEMYEYMEQQKWDEIVYKYMCIIKEDLDAKITYMPLSLFVGLCHCGFAVKLIVDKTGNYNQFLNSINKIINSNLIKLMPIIKQNRNVQAAQYDLISGVAGIVSYLLICESKEERKVVIGSLLEYLVDLIVGSYQYNGTYVPNWHIKRECLVREEEKAEYINGVFNFSASHGLAGVVSTLLHAQNSGEDVINMDYAIKTGIQIFEAYGLSDKSGITYWPGMMPYEDFVLCNKRNYSIRQSWCYGAIGISGLFSSALEGNHKYQNEYKKQLQNLRSIALNNIENYLLCSPIICHGYAGALLIFREAYRRSNDEVFLIRIIDLIKILFEMYNQDSYYGYRNKYFDPKENKYLYSESNDFLEGTSGIIMALCSIIKPDIAFHKLLLL